jgi:hypothetical protein
VANFIVFLNTYHPLAFGNETCTVAPSLFSFPGAAARGIREAISDERGDFAGGRQGERRK